MSSVRLLTQCSASLAGVLSISKPDAHPELTITPRRWVGDKVAPFERISYRFFSCWAFSAPQHGWAAQCFQLAGLVQLVRADELVYPVRAPCHISEPRCTYCMYQCSRTVGWLCYCSSSSLCLLLPFLLSLDIQCILSEHGYLDSPKSLASSNAGIRRSVLCWFQYAASFIVPARTKVAFLS